MNEFHKILEDLADSELLKNNPKARGKIKKQAAEAKKEHEDAVKELNGRYIMAKLLDIFAACFLIGVIVIVFTLFSRSLFEGFVSTILGFWALRYIFLKRNDDWFSWFRGWF